MPASRRRPPGFVSWVGVAYRATSYDVPLWVSPNRRAGRWNIAGHGCTQYFCLDAEAPYAEMLRAENLRTEAEARTFFSHLWQVRIDDGAIVDYSTFEKAEDAGFPAEALVEDDHERCQAEAEFLKSHGAGGLLSPSAALPGSISLTLFGPRVQGKWDSTVELASMLPTQRLLRGSPPPDLVHRTCYYGQDHSGLREFRHAQRRLFDVPAKPRRRRRD
jgi:RES domain-containing protein